jgi:ubiquinone/menaquinone biosynthesis C-methylase UbiE
MNAIDYHLEELEIARTPGDPRWIMPTLPARFSSILDLGCGIGQTLIACELKPETFACGVDIEAEVVAFGQALTPRFHFVCAQGERLPFRERSFEVVISRVALPYMEIPRALAEIARVVTPGGYVWFTLHPFARWREDTRNALRAGNLKGVIYAIYVLLNGICFHLTGRQFRYPLKRQRCESFQTIGSITRAMQQAGFEQVRTKLGRFFVVTAVMPDRAPTAAAKEETLCVESAA